MRDIIGSVASGNVLKMVYNAIGSVCVWECVRDRSRQHECIPNPKEVIWGIKLNMLLFESLMSRAGKQLKTADLVLAGSRQTLKSTYSSVSFHLSLHC